MPLDTSVMWLAIGQSCASTGQGREFHSPPLQNTKTSKEFSHDASQRRRRFSAPHKAAPRLLRESHLMALSPGAQNQKCTPAGGMVILFLGV